MDPSSSEAGDCVADADAALYRSKRAGRNTVAAFQAELDTDPAPVDHLPAVTALSSSNASRINLGKSA
jgi:hypothetical protein